MFITLFSYLFEWIRSRDDRYDAKGNDRCQKKKNKKKEIDLDDDQTIDRSIDIPQYSTLVVVGVQIVRRREDGDHCRKSSSLTLQVHSIP
jgi:hypothetical protein